MCTWIALAASELPVGWVERHALTGHVHSRGGEAEVRFLSRAPRPVLPVWIAGDLHLVRWGSRRGQTRTLPATGWTWRETVRAGTWGALGGVPVEIPASLGYEGGVWFRIRQGIHGVLAHDESGRPAVYLVVEPSTHYYQTMTRSRRMPCLIGEVI